SYLISSASITLPTLGFSANFHRGQIFGNTPQGQRTWIPASSEYIDGLQLTGNAGDDGLRILTAIRKHISMAPPAAVVDSGGSALAQSAAILNRVSEAVVTLVSHTSD